MSKLKNKNIFNDDTFFDFTACDCEMGFTPESRSVKKYTFHLYPKKESPRYVYGDGKELLLIEKKGGRESKIPVLPDLLAIKDDDVESAKEFIEKHGFLLPISIDENNSIEADSVFALIKRLKALFLLLSALGDKSVNYEKLTGLTLYLLLSPQTKIELCNGKKRYSSCPHTVSQLLQGNYKRNEDYSGPKNTDSNSEELFNSNNGSNIVDFVRPPHTWLDFNEYNYAISHCGDNPESLRGKITLLFKDATYVDSDCCLAIDFLYHFIRDVGEIEKCTHNGELIFVGKNVLTSERFKNNFDEQLQAAIVKLAKHVLKTELEYNLRGIAPLYDTELMVPKLHVKYLLSGLYFSLFNMQTKEYEYRICEKSGCGRYFFTKKSSVKQKHCSKKCAGAKASNVHRQKMKAQKSDK